MYPLQPLRVYALQELQDDPLCLTRLERMLGAMNRSASDVTWVSDRNLCAAAQELAGLWPPAEPPEGVPAGYLRPLVFTRVSCGEEPPDLSPTLGALPDPALGETVRRLLGHFPTINAYHPYARDWEENRVCWPTWDFKTVMGCPHQCHYCGDGKSGKFITIALNLEEFMEQVVPRIAAKFPWQRCFRMIGWGADIITLEPEYGCFDLYTRTLAELDRYGYFHTAGANVDWVADLPRKDRLIGVFSVTCEAVARDIEPGTGHAFDRFDAGRKLNQMGVPVRYKFKPMIPVRHWREEYARAIEYMLKVSRPESVGFCVLMWMSLEAVGQRLDLDLLDPEFVAAAREAAPEMEGSVTAPFPHEVRREIYEFLIEQVRRWDKDVPLYISTESREMWAELAPKLGQDPRAFFCGCTPVGLPGRRLSLSPGCPHSTYSEFAGAQSASL